MNDIFKDNVYSPFDGMIDSKVSYEKHIDIFNAVLSKWTERPQLENGCNFTRLRFYDGIIGYVIEKGNQVLNENQWFPKEDFSFVSIWKYQGTIYRVIQAPKSRIRYHKKIASWTKDINAFDKFNHLYSDMKYTFLVADTKESIGFDVNKYRNNIGERHCYTEHEKEVIFPMDRKYITDIFYGTLDEFKDYIKK